jgi:intein/homing endonuclease
MSTSKDKRYDDVYGYKVAFANDECFNSLVAIGITERKSLTLKLKIPITWDFVRGVFDGDGCVYQINKRPGGPIRGSISISTASFDFFNQLKTFLINEGLTPTSETRKKEGLNPLYTVRINKAAEMLIVYNKFYSSASYYLERKYKKFGALTYESRKDNTANSGKDCTSNPELADN